VEDKGLYLMDMNDEILAKNLDLMKQNQLVHPLGRFGNVENCRQAAQNEDQQQGTESYENSFLHRHPSYRFS
jgi:hypothetical protein